MGDGGIVGGAFGVAGGEVHRRRVDREVVCAEPVKTGLVSLGGFQPVRQRRLPAGAGGEVLEQPPAESGKLAGQMIRQIVEPAGLFERVVAGECPAERAGAGQRQDRPVLDRERVRPGGERLDAEIIGDEMAGAVARLADQRQPRGRRPGSGAERRHGTDCTAGVVAMSLADLFWFSSSEMIDMVSRVWSQRFSGSSHGSGSGSDQNSPS